MKSYNNLLLVLYRGALDIPTNEFRDWALNETKSILSFDSCVWFTGNWIDDKAVIHSVHLHNLDNDFVSNWKKYEHEDTLATEMSLDIGKTFNVDAAEMFSGTSIYEFHCKPYAMEHIVSTCNIDADTQLINSMSFYRSNPDTPFSEEERCLKGELFPHLVAALRTNWLNHLSQNISIKERNPLNTIASCDTFGVLRVAMPSFIETCRKEWHGWKGPILPECIQESIRNNASRYVGKHIVASIHCMEGLLLIQARPLIDADYLSTRELEVAQRYAIGEDYKTIAQKLLISPSTVKAHLNKIYLKLNINDKASLAAKLNQMIH